MRSKASSFKCKSDDEGKNNLKNVSTSQSKHIKSEECNNLLDGEDYRKECDEYILRLLNHEIYLQQTKKSALSVFDDK